MQNKYKKLNAEQIAKLTDAASKEVQKLSSNPKYYNLGRRETSIAGKNAAMPKWGDAWDKAQEEIIRKDYKAGTPLADTAATLGRSRVAVWYHRKQMGLTGKENGKTRTTPKVRDDKSKSRLAQINAAIIQAKRDVMKEKDNVELPVLALKYTRPELKAEEPKKKRKSKKS